MDVAVLLGISSWLADHVIEKLVALLKERRLQIQTEAWRSIDSIKAHLEIVQTRLSEVQDNRPFVEEFLRSLKDVSYDIEDLVDHQFMVERRADKASKNFLAKLKNNRGILRRLHKAKSRLEELRRSMNKHAPGDGPYGRVNLPAASPRSPASEADASSLVGMDGPRDELAKLLIEDDPESASRLKVISIVGFGGLGKTTLANEVYSTTKQYFDCDAWVPVSRNPNMMNILVGILRQVEDRHITRAEGQGDERYLIDEIRKSLQHKRYLIVVDDIWSTETWDIIKSALPLNHFGSRVITTTRKQSVAESCCSHWNDHVYNLQPLSVMDSKELFFRRIFGSSDRCPADLEDVSHKILKKCSGLPLAITAISGLLANKQNSSTWDDVYKSLSGIPETIEGAENIFLISYYGLPYSLKTCLLYLSLFPEDYVISRDLIISLWIAEGFIMGNHVRTPEEVGQSYLDELINRKMIQPTHGFYDGKPEAYIIHGMVLDFVKAKAAEENVVTILENEGPVSALPNKIRRVSIINNDKNHYIPASMAKSHIRSLSIFGGVGPELSFKQMTVLRVFLLEGCKNLEDRSIREIAGLVNLRYLSIRNTPITQLPDQIAKLQHLTTLDVRGTEVNELPVSVGSLQKLTHLHCDKMRVPEWIGKMLVLSCLLQFDIFRSKILAVQELGKLSELKHLVLWWSPDDLQSDNTERYECFATSLYRLIKLQSLVIHGSDASVDILDYLRHRLRHLHRIHVNRSCYLNRIAEWLGSLPKLEYVCVDIKEVVNKDLMLLSQLPALIHLSLSSKVMPTEKLVITSSGFPVLREFQLHSVKADLTFESQAMQKLEILLLSLHLLPEEKYDFSIKISQFTCLKKFDVRINGKGAAASQFFADAYAAIRKAAEGHPNRPTVNVLLFGNLVDYAAKLVKQKENEQKLEPIEEK